MAPKHRRGRGSSDIRPIPQLLLTLIAFCGEFSSSNHVAETQSMVATPEILGYFTGTFLAHKLTTMRTVSYSINF